MADDADEAVVQAADAARNACVASATRLAQTRLEKTLKDVVDAEAQRKAADAGDDEVGAHHTHAPHKADVYDGRGIIR